MSGFLYFMAEIKLSTITNHTLYLLWVFIMRALSFVFACACVHMFIYTTCSMSVYVAAAFLFGELFHVVRNEIRPTPCSLLSGFYLGSRLAQVISFLWSLVRRGSARSTSTASCVDERERDGL